MDNTPSMNMIHQLAQELPNAIELAQSHDQTTSTLLGLFSGTNPQLKPLPHDTDYSPETAVRKMFLLQLPTNKNEPGKLVVGDFDHVVPYNWSPFAE
jgi:hypothetical protein